MTTRSRETIPPEQDDDLWSPWKGLLRAVILGLGGGLAAGLLFFVLTWLLQDWVRATDFSPRSYSRHSGPLVLLPFLLAAIFVGRVTLRLAERASSLTGFVLMVPVTGSTAVAVGVCAVLAKALVTPWTDQFRFVFLMLTLGLLISAALKIWRTH